MATTVIKTQTTRKHYTKLAAMLVTPYVFNNTIQSYIPGDTTYDLYSIIGDTVSISQELGDRVSKYCEFSPFPVITNTDMGTWSFSADCMDMQNEVLKLIYSVTENQGDVYFSEDVKGLPCCIELQFNNENAPHIVLPYVMLDSTFHMESMKTSFLKNAITGTIMTKAVSVRGDAVGRNKYKLVPIDNDAAVHSGVRGVVTEYQKYTPMMFLKTDRSWGVWTDDDKYLYFIGDNKAYTYLFGGQVGFLTQLGTRVNE